MGNGDQKNQQASFRNVLLNFLYPISMVVFIVWSVVAAVAGIWVVVVAYGLATEPTWFDFALRVLNILTRIMNPSGPDASKLLDTFSLAFGAGMLGILVQRCSTPVRRFEFVVVLSLMLLGALQLAILFSLPLPKDADINISAGTELVQALSKLLDRDANVALAACSAALGINFVSKA